MNDMQQGGLPNNLDINAIAEILEKFPETIAAICAVIAFSDDKLKEQAAGSAKER